MINNRQNGRRRGRGGQQARNGQPGAPDRGNRLDNRARGNAAQLLEKYKTLARDAQMQGDRVNTEYYLQFADHYFRVLSENRARFEEQRPASRPNDNRDEFGDDDGGNDQRGYQGRDDQNGDDGWDDGDQQPQPEQQRTYAPRQERGERQSYQGDNGGNGDAVREGGNRDAANREGGDREVRGRDGGNREGGSRDGGNREGGRDRSRRNSNGANGNGANGNSGSNEFAAPAFLNEPLSPRFDLDRGSDGDDVRSADAEADQGAAPAPKPRRTRRPRGEAAPAEV
ncbi:DUF4167 domain-containing protein [Sphingomonas crusticola]|uniref:DUF4167 domain-containing protein n=1 Tax=Sphingomonas crusticola TaxID=1697973 RepID=UPI000E280AD5|nr:DUF4167 domain-containing protein [Sphingomonas crusticola]